MGMEKSARKPIFFDQTHNLSPCLKPSFPDSGPGPLVPEKGLFGRAYDMLSYGHMMTNQD